MQQVASSSASPAPRLSLPPVQLPSGYSFPSLYSFPPFFTKQPNEQTWSHQSTQWATLILSYARHHRLFRLELTDESCDTELFRNKTIDRRLPLSALRTVIQSMVLAGTADYDPPLKTKGEVPTGVLIYWRRPEEWATLIYDWVKETGVSNSILTFYELVEGGDMAHTTEFYKLPEPLLRRSLDVLIKAGKAQVFKGLGEDGDGVKFV